MPPQAEQLVVRQHERLHCRLSVQLRVADEAAEQVSMARSIGDGSGAIEAFVTDASRGGLGIESPVFYPRGCRVRVRVKPSASGKAPEKEFIVRVQRVSMLTRTPTYYLGVSFTAKGPEHDQAVSVMLEMARQNQSVAGAPGAAPAAFVPARPGVTPPLPPTPPSTASGKGGN